MQRVIQAPTVLLDRQTHTSPESFLTDLGAFPLFRRIFVVFLEPHRVGCAMMSAIEEAHPFMAYQSAHPNHPTSRAEFLAAINEAHTRSGLSLREIAQVCDLDHTYLHLILQGKRHPHRDVLISLCTFGWHLDPIETDTILMADGHPPLGRSVRREYSASSANQASVDGTIQPRGSN